MGNFPVADSRDIPSHHYIGESAGSNAVGIYAPMIPTYAGKHTLNHSFSMPGESGSSGGFQDDLNKGGINKDLKTNGLSESGITFGDPFQGSEENAKSQATYKKEVINNLNTRLKNQSENSTGEHDINNNNNDKLMDGKTNSTKDNILNNEAFVEFRKDWTSSKSGPSYEIVDKQTDGSDKIEGKVKLENSKQTELTPSILQEKVITWCNLKVRYNNERGGSFQEKIIVTLPDGKEVMGKSRRTTPYSVARNISKGLAREGVVAMVDDKLWDFNRPLESSCKLILLKYNDPRAKKVFQNSSALLLGAALERVYGGKACSHLCGETEFCYDMYIPDRKISFFDFPEIENMVKSIVNEQLLFERMEVRKEDVFKFFKSNEYKRKIINELITPTVTMYRVGSFIDICEGPIVQHTGKIKAFKITKTLVTHWKKDPTLKPLQRLCGASFPDKKKMNQWEKGQKNIIKIDHRSIGRNQELFFFDEMSPGSPFFLPKGTHIFNKLVNFMKSEYWKRGFKEVITPNLFKAKLWEISGLLEHYQSNMFSFEAEEEKFVLKPMNCPGHCLIFDHKQRSWRELPLRLADFGVLHRKECSEGLLGMTRLHRFQQDDAHIFCTTGQIKSEITRALDFLKYVYEVLGLDFHLLLSTRPEKFMGEKALWDEAENQLVESLNAFGEPWKESPGEGAFYGPKIDVKIQDYQQRSHQCATIQLDFQLPIRFGLSYKNQNNEMSRPVIIHQAMLGSVERMIGILAESYEGKWPFWLSPHQAMVIPVVPKFNKYAVEVKQQLVDAGFECLVNEHPAKPFDKKLKNAQVGGYNFILTVGQREVNTETVNVRSRNNYIKGIFTIPEIIQKFQHLTEVKNTTDRFY